jgi:hypothetical protein
MGWGQTLRNEWKLWDNGPLKDYFNKLGIHHPDDMSGIVLTSFYRKLVGKGIDFDTQIEHYKKYWAKFPQTDFSISGHS